MYWRLLLKKTLLHTQRKMVTKSEGGPFVNTGITGAPDHVHQYTPYIVMKVSKR